MNTRLDTSMLELFRLEVETHTAVMTEGLLALEQDPEASVQFEPLMRAAHSIKGAARLVKVPAAESVAHIMEDCFDAAWKGEITLTSGHIDILLRGVDILARIGASADQQPGTRNETQEPDITALLKSLTGIIKGESGADTAAAEDRDEAPPDSRPAGKDEPPPAPGRDNRHDRVLRISTERINKLMGLAGESLVESRWISGYTESITQVKKHQIELVAVLDRLRSSLDDLDLDQHSADLLGAAQRQADTCRHELTSRITDLEEFDRRTTGLAERLNREVISSRMRPFSDGVQGFHRMVRDLARSLGKQVKFEISGLNTQVDRDILERIEAPLNHLIRNAVDHGIESPDERKAAGKPVRGIIHLEAMHNSGMLAVIVSDDGRGIGSSEIRDRIVERKLVSRDMAQGMADAELMEFLFLPGFSTRSEVTEISGRGFGMDVVRSVMQEMHGQVRASSKPGEGLRIHMQMPLTLSVIRCLLTRIAGEYYAFPLARINRVTLLDKDAVKIMEDRQYFTLENDSIGLVSGNQVLDTAPANQYEEIIPVVVLGDRLRRYGLVVDEFMGEHDLAVQPLDPRLGKIQNVAASALMEDGSPVLIIDVDDIVQSIENLVSGNRIHKISRSSADQATDKDKRILVVDDSITVRGVEKHLLESNGYHVDIAVDGMDGWNTVRTNRYDLVISDIDMPRMNGIEFVKQIKQDAKLRSIPVMIVSYKDHARDRELGLEAGADYYLTKGSFHDESLLEAVADLIGEAGT